MLKFKNLLLTLVITTLMSSTMLAGNVIVKVIMTNGEENCYTMNGSSTITYSESEMYLNAIEGSVTFQISEIRKVLFERTTGMEENEAKTLLIYPNPVKDIIFLTNSTDNQNVTIYSATGSVVLKSVVSNNTIDVRDLSNGVYFIKINNQIAKIIKL